MLGRLFSKYQFQTSKLIKNFVNFELSCAFHRSGFSSFEKCLHHEVTEEIDIWKMYSK